MTSHLSDDIYANLEAGRRTGQRIRSTRTVVVNNQVFPIVKFDDDGFVLRACDAKGIRGLVAIHDGGELVCEALIMASSRVGDNIRFDYKRSTPVSEMRAMDFLRAEVETATGLRKVA